MSGGRLDYICYKVDEVADQMGDRELNALMKDVGELLHDREWHLSGDICEAAFEETKRECMEMIGGMNGGE